MIQKHAHDCGCVVTVYSDGSAPPDIEYCDEHESRDPQTEIFDLMLATGESNRLRAAELIRQLTPEQKRDLRGTCQDLEGLIDDVFLQQLREGRRKAK